MVAATALLGASLAWSSSSSGQVAAMPRGANPQHRAEDGEMIQRTKKLSWTLTYNSDLNVNLSGGRRAGPAYLQRVGLIADADLAQLIGWRGVTLHASVHAINGVGLSAHSLDNILTVSGLEAEPALRLFNLWIEQSVGRGLSLRIGQFTAGQEFMLSGTANLFVNSTFGWPGSFATDLPSGGPAYPLAAAGLRLAISPTQGTTVRVALFAGDPAGPGKRDPQRRDLHGLNGFRLEGSPFIIGEINRSFGGSDPFLSLGLGGWVHLDRFDDQRLDTERQSFASLASNGEPLRHRGNYAVYAMADARLWVRGPQSLHAFVRGSASPPDRNPIDTYVDAGLSLNAPVRARPDDTVGLAVGIARWSPQLISLVREQAAMAGIRQHVPGSEAVIEMSYQFKLNPRAYFQPDLQWIFHPSGSIVSGQLGPDRLRARAIVVGLRTSLTL